jgi:hypothetical protein
MKLAHCREPGLDYRQPGDKEVQYVLLEMWRAKS